MKPLKLFLQPLAIALTLAFVGCSDNNDNTLDKTVNVSFRPTIDAEITRAIADGSAADQLVVAVFDDEMNFFSRKTIDMATATAQGVNLQLVPAMSYKILFWAQHADNGAYTIANDGTVSIDYATFANAGFAGMENLDAFCATVEITVSGTSSTEVALRRPLAQINFADATTAPVAGTNKATVTLKGVATAYNPFTSTASGSADATFTFTDFTNETLIADGTTYHYVATAYAFAPTSERIDADYSFAQGETVIRTSSFSAIPVTPNKRTNIVGNIVTSE
ncbi:MAG: FimB/Mfa2 family fimbrial subunit [Candidatus Limisoma sp.]|nr:FimB/Mfa2 family fimbrial subunit [Candidatus Limisoma sp.]